MNNINQLNEILSKYEHLDEFILFDVNINVPKKTARFVFSYEHEYNLSLLFSGVNKWSCFCNISLVFNWPIEVSDHASGNLILVDFLPLEKNHETHSRFYVVAENLVIKEPKDRPAIKHKRETSPAAMAWLRKFHG